MLGSYKNHVALILILFGMNIHSCFAENKEIYTNSSSVAKSRMKRYLIFQPGTRIFFRINIKDNIIQVNQIFAHAFGFRANIDLLQPDQLRPGHKVRRRDVYETLEQLINQHGLNGRACILKTFCDASKETRTQSGMFSKLFKLIFTQRMQSDTNSVPTNDERDLSYLASNNCEELEKHCPLSLLEMTPYTDI